MDKEELIEQDEEQIEDTHEEVPEESGETPDSQEENQDEESDLVVSLDGEQAEEEEQEASDAPKWVKNLRKEHRSVVRELKELKAEKARQEQQANSEKQMQLGPRPKMSDSDIDYDEDVFNARLDAWHQQKAEIEAKERTAREQQEKAAQEWNQKVQAHQKAASQLRVPDYEDAEEVVRETFSDLQQAILLESENSALLAYAIGKRPAKAKELASISNPVKFAMALAKLETQVKTAPKKTAPAPETRVRPSAPVSGVVDSKLAKLMEEADRTGDRTKVAAYYREQSRKR